MQGKGCSQEHSRYEIVALGRAHNLSECNIQGPLSHTGHKGTAVEDIRLRHIFPSLQGYYNLTNQLLNKLSWLKALYSHTNTI